MTNYSQTILEYIKENGIDYHDLVEFCLDLMGVEDYEKVDLGKTLTALCFPWEVEGDEYSWSSDEEAMHHIGNIDKVLGEQSCTN